MGRGKSYVFTVMLALLGLVILFTSIYDFGNQIQNRERELQVLTLEQQAAEVGALVEAHMQDYLHTLLGIRTFLDTEELLGADNMTRMAQIINRGELPFARLALSGVEGQALFTDGSQMDIGQREYFRQVLAGNVAITQMRISDSSASGGFAVVVPVYEANDRVCGVLMGTVSIGNFILGEEMNASAAVDAIRIIDRNGYCILRSGEGVLAEGNLIDNLKQMQTSVSVVELAWAVRHGTQTMTEISENGQAYIACFSPVKINDWTVVTLIKKERIAQQVNYLLGYDAYWLVLRVGAAALVLCGIIIHFIRREQFRIREEYNRIRMNDDLLRAALAGTHTIILRYDVPRDALCVVHSDPEFSFPKRVEHASRELRSILPLSARTPEQLQTIFARLPAMERSEVFDLELMVGGMRRNFRIHAHRMNDSSGRLMQCVALVQDVTGTVSLQQEVLLRNRLLSGIEGFADCDLDADTVLRASADFDEWQEDNTYSRCIGRWIERSVGGEYRAQLNQRLSIAYLRAAYERGERELMTEYPRTDREGETIWVECQTHLEVDHGSGHLLACHVLRNIDASKRRELMLKETAGRDDLTGLFNRRGAMEEINRCLRKESQGHHAFILLDLDDFKAVNDTLGHRTGDTALVDVARALRDHFREYDILCRLAGDEFVVFAKHMPPEAVQHKMKQLIEGLSHTYEGEKGSVSVSASAGVAIVPEHGTSFNELYQKADEALYRAKAQGKHSACIYAP